MKRLVSLDFFRGMTIALMVVVNTPGSWNHVYAPLLHAEWHGVTPADLVFPFFLFIVGVSITLAYHSKKLKNGINASTYQKILKRTFIIFMLGLFLALFPKFDFENLRVVGVLQRIALVFCFCAILYLNTGWRGQLLVGIFCLIIYYVLLCFIPFDGMPAGTLEPGNNFSAWIDRFITPGRMYRETWDPEGLFSTIPAFSTTIAGMLAGRIIIDKTLPGSSKIIWIFIAGLSSFSLGYMWDYVFPANKHIWTSTYVLIHVGLAALFLSASMWIIDELGYQKWTKLGVVYGMNAITAYVLHGIIWRIFQIPVTAEKGIQSLWMSGLVDIGLSSKLASFLWALSYMLLIYFFALILYRKKIFIKV